MKQTKTTLVFGVLLAIIVAVLAMLQFQSATKPNTRIDSEEVIAAPTMRKGLSLHRLIEFL